MKLTMKLLIALGLSFIFGMQAFAGENPYGYVKITNIDCSSSFNITWCPFDPKAPPGRDCYTITKPFTVKPGPEGRTIKLLPSTSEGGTATVCPSDHIWFIGCKGVPLNPGVTSYVVFQIGKVIKRCFPMRW